MTNPFLPAQPQQQQPQGNPYAPAAPAAPANPYAPAAPAQPQYTQQPAQQPMGNPYAQQAAPVAGAGLVAQPGQFTTPPPPSPSGSNLPKIADLQGRLLIVMPESLQHGIVSKFTNRDGSAQYQDRMTATVVVLDGGPLQWGGTQPGSQRQHGDVPYVIKGLWIQQSKLIEQLGEPLRMRQAGQAGLALGRLWKTGTAASDPYVLAAPSPEDAAQYDRYVSQVNPFAL